MKVTNKQCLPESLVKVAIDSIHSLDKDRYSATEILKSTREILLSRRHFDEIEVDVADLIPAIFGSAVHKLFEDNNVNGQAEMDLQISGLKGICDLYHDKTVEDYKTTSVSKVMYKDFEDHRKQCLIYAYMIMITKGEKPNKIRINYLMKDWSKIQSTVRAGYPASPIYVHEVDILDSDYDGISEYINSKLKVLKDNESVKDEDLPLCTNEEKWNPGDKYAAYKKQGDKRAIKVCDTEEEAKQIGGFVEKRKGENMKCNHYCNCKEFCSQYKAEKNC